MLQLKIIHWEQNLQKQETSLKADKRVLETQRKGGTG